jgi:ribosomal protein S21
MANVTRVRIDINDLPREMRSLDMTVRANKDKVFRAMLKTFNKAVSSTGVVSEYKQRETFESPGEKKRRKRRESARERAKDRNREKRG